MLFFFYSTTQDTAPPVIRPAARLAASAAMPSRAAVEPQAERIAAAPSHRAPITSGRRSPAISRGTRTCR